MQTSAAGEKFGHFEPELQFSMLSDRKIHAQFRSQMAPDPLEFDFHYAVA